MTPKSPLFRYAYGHSDEKPGWGFWLLIAAATVISVFCIMTIASPAHAKAPSREAAASNCLSKADVWRKWGQDAYPKFRKTERGKCWYAAGKSLPRAAAKKKLVRYARVTTPATVIAAPVVEAPLEPVAVKTIVLRPSLVPEMPIMTPAETVRFRWWQTGTKNGW
jgi:hypothetical protein